MLTAVTFYILLFLPGQRQPVMHAKENVPIEECLEDVKYLLERVNPEWPAGAVMQAGCSVKIPDHEDANKTDGKP